MMSRKLSREELSAPVDVFFIKPDVTIRYPLPNPNTRKSFGFDDYVVDFERGLNEYFKSVGYYRSDSGRDTETNIRELVFRDLIMPASK